ncbi:isopentenyl-diphosphate Delta-isomerase [Microbacterium esteraromaticum]|uniref:Isopentenyl-diphosphate Delta-isomerase n=1 Tax=Microbacterium esteraromaticum TaxID=57043 RepID=A0A939DW35_9MICO|nr:isopentenyl-diphosphate Delta-isomerase [Microbacterium esteraromaticum]MBN8206069.1 isopentenyl-diphosphate Delta-isomerase [Microbacterium esteraromaticum]MBN8416224.1 isopentenyl-diphosphate Delta-isomerase [Microbacterium esteraromaticum]MBN8423419.1 isopentenyl-diphosphate Delta-isomerase [Microbacterium esteraromaticum]
MAVHRTSPEGSAHPEGRVVLLNESGQAIGTADKEGVHNRATPLHLAFSCYLFDADGNVLITRRALGKRSWPGVWTNSFCGHPEPGEDLTSAVERRALQELGAQIRDVRVVDPDFRYRAVDAGGIVENEVCPVHRATVIGPLSPNPDEVMQWAWVAPEALLRSAELTPFAFSPWMILQAPALARMMETEGQAR